MTQLPRAPPRRAAIRRERRCLRAPDHARLGQGTDRFSSPVLRHRLVCSAMRLPAQSRRGFHGDLNALVMNDGKSQGRHQGCGGGPVMFRAGTFAPAAISLRLSSSRPTTDRSGHCASPC
jgi:hypothetical protein